MDNLNCKLLGERGLRNRPATSDDDRGYHSAFHPARHQFRRRALVVLPLQPEKLEGVADFGAVVLQQSFDRHILYFRVTGGSPGRSKMVQSWRPSPWREVKGTPSKSVIS